jgi:hypothetical protein
VVGFDMNSWTELSISNGELLAYDFPKGPGSFSD